MQRIKKIFMIPLMLVDIMNLMKKINLLIYIKKYGMHIYIKNGSCGSGGAHLVVTNSKKIDK